MTNEAIANEIFNGVLDTLDYGQELTAEHVAAMIELTINGLEKTDDKFGVVQEVLNLAKDFF